MKTHFLKTVLCASALFAVALVATPVHADDELVTLSSSDVTVTEGDFGSMLFTLTNDLPTSIDLGSFSVEFIPTSGDLSDVIADFATFDPVLSTCGATLASMSSCNWVFDFGTHSGAGETDGDFGVELGEAGQFYNIPTIGAGYIVHAPDFTVTVYDPLVTTPEPSSLLLLGSGLLGMLGLGRKRLI